MGATGYASAFVVSAAEKKHWQSQWHPLCKKALAEPVAPAMSRHDKARIVICRSNYLVSMIWSVYFTSFSGLSSSLSLSLIRSTIFS